MSDGVKANGITQDCATFQDGLAALFESEEDVHAQPHLQTCDNCRTLVQELQYIVDQVKILLPLHDPSPKVWENIQSELKKESSPAE